MQRIQIGSFTITEHSRPLIVAEVGINHNGDLENARRLIDAAALAGADIVKFQTHLPDCEMLRSGPTAGYIGESFYGVLQRCTLSVLDHAILMRQAANLGILFMSTPFCMEAADLLDELDVPAFKVGSGELTNIPLQQHIARKRKPMIISTGMSTLDEVAHTVDAVLHLNHNIILLNCTSTYPAAHKDIRLLGIRQLRERFGLLVGQSDHSVGIATCLGAVALGAVVIEKHFTLSRSWPGPDQAASIEPEELKRLVVESKQIWEAMQERGLALDGEIPVQQMARHSIVTLATIHRGEPLTAKNIGVKRPGTGIPAARLDDYVGLTARRDIAADILLRQEDVCTY